MQTLKLFLVVLFISACLATAGWTTPNRILTDKPLLFGGNSDFAPFEFLTSDGIPDGFTIDLIKAVAREEGLNIEISLGIWSDVRKKLKEGQVDGLTGMLHSKERDKLFDFSVPYLVVPYMVFIRNDAPFTSIKELKGKEIIVVQDVFVYEWAIENSVTESLITVKAATDALQLLASGKHDCAILPRLHGLNLLKDLELNNIETFGPPVLVKYLCFAVAEGNSSLLAELNDGLFTIRHTGEYDEIYLKWFSVHEYQKRIGRLAAYIFLTIGIIVIMLFTVIFWNKSLKSKVAQKTEELCQNETRLNQIVEGIPIPTYVIDETRTVTHWNRACEILTGFKSESVIGTNKYCSALYGDQTYSTVDLLMDNVLTKPIQQHEGKKYRESSMLAGVFESEGNYNDKWLYVTAALLKDPDGKVDGAIETWQDFTEYKQLENQLIQSQKMEAIGTLAGGIAHDFNNILSAVIGYAELTLMDLPKESSTHDYQKQILSASMRAKALVNQILTFSRQDEGNPKPIRLSVIVKETLDMIRASLPSTIKVEQNLESDGLVMADATHVHQVVMNLCTNASHAMVDSGGVLRVSVSEARLEKTQRVTDVDINPDRYLKLNVEDTGRGIPTQNQNKVFNPFYTTKKRGEGTGMGLSVTHGIVKRYGGHIEFVSQPDKGTVFSVYLPIVTGEAISEAGDA